STTTSNQSFLSAVRAEVAVAQTGQSNTFGHPNRETVNKFLNTATTTGASFTGTGVPPATGAGPVFYQNEASPAGDDRVTLQGYTGAAPGNAGQGTIQLTTDGTTTYSLTSFDADGARVDYAITAIAGGQTTTYRSGYFSGVTPIATIRAITAKGEPLYTGYAARVQGTVTASGFSAGTNDDYIQDPTGGVNVYRST